jgi:eukaryotic-like serine/threonine-protein kinase
MSPPSSPPIASQSSASSAGFGLPRPLLAKARERLRVLLWLFLFAATLSLAVRAFRLFGGAPLADEAYGLAYVSAGAFLSSLCLGLARLHPRRPGFALRLGVGYEVLTGWVIAIGGTFQEVARHGHVPFLTWAAALVIVFPLIVPTPPRTTLALGLATGASAPAAVAIVSALGLVEAHGGTYVEVLVSPIIATAFAYFGSRVVYGLNRDYVAAAQAGSYVLRTKLGEGGMGEVWRADHQSLARPAAVKLIRVDRLGVDAGENAAVERFEREAQATALLRSPHTVAIYDYGVTDQGALFYAMELLDGIDLDSLVQRFGALPPARVAHILSQVAASLAEAHDKDLIHRDVKPANIYLCRYGLVADFVKVLDFGLVKAHGELGGAHRVSLSKSGTIQGTPAFIAPEQIADGRAVTAAADVYALGCVAYYLLAGRVPFAGRTVMEVMVQHLSVPPQPLADLVPNLVPAELEALVLDCMAKDPARRPASMQVVSERLAQIAMTERWTQSHAQVWWHDHPTAAPLGTTQPPTIGEEDTIVVPLLLAGMSAGWSSMRA